MQWKSWAEFWTMDGNGLYVWGSYGLFLLLVILELVLVRTGHKAMLQRILRRRKR